MAGQTDPLELNMRRPIIAWEALSTPSLLRRIVIALAERCIAWIYAYVKRSREWIERSLALVTPLSLRVGNNKAAEIAQKALAENHTIREVVVADGIFTPAEADKLLDRREMLGPKAQTQWVA